MADELVDIFDESNNFTGVTKMKSEAHKDGSWHRAVHCIIYNSKGKMLIQQRAKDKMLYANLWDISAAGHVGAGEEPIISCMREVEEELGLIIDIDDLKFYKINKTMISEDFINNNEFGYIFFLKFEGDINQLKMQDEEVQAIKFLSLDELEKELDINYSSFCPHGDYWFEILTEVKKRL